MKIEITEEEIKKITEHVCNALIASQKRHWKPTTIW